MVAKRENANGCIQITGFFDEFTGAAVVDSSLVLWLDAGQTTSYSGSGNTWIDLSGNGKNGTLHNGAAYDVNNGGSISFDGTNDHVNTTFNTDIASTGFTFNIWFTNSRTTTQFLASYDNGTDATTVFRIERNNSGTTTIEFGHTPSGGAVTELISTNFPNDVWTNCTLVYDGNFKYIYKNGALDSTSASGQTLSHYAGAVLRLGARYNSNLPILGNIAVVQLYNTALTSTQISQNFNAFRRRFGI